MSFLALWGGDSAVNAEGGAVGTWDTQTGGITTNLGVVRMMEVRVKETVVAYFSRMAGLQGGCSVSEELHGLGAEAGGTRKRNLPRKHDWLVAYLISHKPRSVFLLVITFAAKAERRGIGECSPSETGVARARRRGRRPRSG